MSSDERPGERPDDSALDALERHTGQRPGVHLSGAEEGEEPLQTPAREDFVPRRRDDYQIQGEIARGGMGRVLTAHDPDLGRDLAIKVLDERFAGRPDVLLAQLFAERTTDGSDRARFLRILESVAQTIAYAHSRGVVHRGLESAKVMVDAFGDWASPLARRQLETARAELGD